MKEVFLLLVIVGIVVAVVMLRQKATRRRNALANHTTPMVRRFLEQTGYSFVDARGTPPEAQAARWRDMYMGSMKGGAYEVRFARNFRGLELHWHHALAHGYRVTIWSQTWTLFLPRPPRVLFHLCERANLDPQRQGNWRPAYEQPVPTGDYAFDQRFAVFGPDANAVRGLLSNPQLKGTLMQLAYVDLRAQPDRVVFSDPKQDNAIRAMGGAEAALAFTYDPGRTFEISLPIHEQVANILYGIATS